MRSKAQNGELSERIKREAKVVGLKRFQQPSLDAVERRRVQVWGLCLTVLVITALTAVAASWRPGEGLQTWMKPGVLHFALVALAVGLCAYTIEKEFHLRRLGKLLVDERVLNSALSNRLQAFSALSAAGKAVNSVLELGDVLDVILASALDMLGGADGSVMLVEGDAELRVAAVHGRFEVPVGTRVRLGDSISGRVARDRQPVVITGRANELQYPGYEGRAAPPRSAMVVPLVHKGELLGVLNVSAAPDRVFDEYDLHVLALFAEPVAAALANARLFEAERNHVARLVELDRMKSQFVATVSHELRTPLTSIRGAMGAMRRDLTPEQRLELLDVIDRQTSRLSDMVEEMLQSARLERDQQMPKLRRIDLSALVRLVALDCQVADRPVHVEAPATCEVRTDPEAIRRVLSNLVENAYKYGLPPVTVTVEREDDRVLLSVSDRGPGVPEEDRERIFERFHRAERTKSQPGLGLGLAIVRGLVESCGGQVWVEEAPGGGAVFRVSVRTRFTSEEMAKGVDECAVAQRS